jgi:hypothetical protein
MAEAVLVSEDVAAGLELVKLLDQAGFPVTAAVWIYFPDAEEWRLVIRTPRAGKDLLEAYREVATAMDQKGDLRQRLNLARVKLVPPSDRTLQAMGQMIHADGLNTIRFSRNVINGIYIDDALIYRLAA